MLWIGLRPTSGGRRDRWSAVGGVDKAAHLAVGQVPPFAGGVLANLVEFGALQEKLHDSVVRCSWMTLLGLSLLSVQALFLSSV
jgi:hypothetical protein